jgi:hypothetical protein
MKSELSGPVPETPVRDIATAAAYYQNNLGFTLDWNGEELGLAGISKGNCRMFLSASNAKLMSAPESKSWGLHEFTAADLDGNLFRALRCRRQTARIVNSCHCLVFLEIARQIQE